MIVRAKTKQLFDYENLSEAQKNNSKLNIQEIEQNKSQINSYPRRLVFELTNKCNLNCIMCGRNSAEFKPTIFDVDWIKKFDKALEFVEEVTLMGWGEPTMHPQFGDILSHINKYNVKKYFCTNGMNLGKLKSTIFENHVDIIAISIDGATKESNGKIRRGADLDKIVQSLKDIVDYKKEQGLTYPYMNFVFCAMQSNLQELPDIVKLAAEIGLQEVKVVYLTVFDDTLLHESLWGKMDQVKEVFDEAIKLGEQLNIIMKLPHITGTDEAADNYHKNCFVGWRDLFLGSDGYIRPCMSTPDKFFKIDNYNSFEELWNEEEFINFRTTVNDAVKMPVACKRCYQSSHCNWNKKDSFIQIGNDFSPEWQQ